MQSIHWAHSASDGPSDQWPLWNEIFNEMCSYFSWIFTFHSDRVTASHKFFQWWTLIPTIRVYVWARTMLKRFSYRSYNWFVTRSSLQESPHTHACMLMACQVKNNCGDRGRQTTTGSLGISHTASTHVHAVDTYADANACNAFALLSSNTNTNAHRNRKNKIVKVFTVNIHSMCVTVIETLEIE